MTDIGRAGMVMKGEYNSASTYETLDAVSYNNGLYVAKQNVPAGTAPINTSYWQTALIPLDWIKEGNHEYQLHASYSKLVITFSGTGLTRVAHYLLIVTGQNGISNPIAVELGGGGSQTPEIITGAPAISDSLNSKISVFESGIKIDCSLFGSWGRVMLLNLIPSDDVQYTFSYE